MFRIPGGRPASLLLTVMAIAAVVAPAVAVASEGGQPFIDVPADDLVPGEPFQVVGSDLGENTAVAMGLMIGGEEVPLGTLAADSDGSFEATLVLPLSAGSGSFQVVAHSTDGTFASTWVRVGTARAVSRPPPGTVLELVDPSLLIAAAGFVVLAIVLLARGRLRKARQARA